ncbi:DUF1327 domain-containing protein, partial [Escherichia coli]|nr:DUF1327 domain-containing protein [Escherichia coli]
MTQNHELVVKGTRNFENKIAVIVHRKPPARLGVPESFQL